MTAYEAALQALAQATTATFVAERKRLAAELRAKGEKGDAARLELRRKPTASVWVVNQLYWQARSELEAMLSAAASLREGDVGASKPYRAALARLHERAAGILKNAGLGASDSTLRRVATTLAAIAATGGFDPDPPGALAADRDAPGFEAVQVHPSPAKRAVEAPPARTHEARAADTGSEKAPRHERHSANEATRRAAAERARRRDELERARAERAEEKRRKQEHARRNAARASLRRALESATAEIRTRERALASLDKEREKLDRAVRAAREGATDLERKLAQLDEGS